MKASDDFVAESPDHAWTSSHDSQGSDSGSGPGGRDADSSRTRTDDADGSAASKSGSGLLQILFRFVEDAVGSVDGLIEVYADRARLSVRRSIVHAAIGVGVAVCAVVWLITAALAILRGVFGGLTTLWGGREWLGDLTGGLLAWALAAGAIALHLRLSSRRELGRLRAKYERIRNDHGKSQGSASPARDGGGVARSRGSVGDPEDGGRGAAPR